MKLRNLFPVLILLLTLSCQQKEVVSFESLLTEIVDLEQVAQFPDPYFRCMQASSYDRRSVSPDSAFWGANDDGYQGGHFIRTDTVNGIIEKVCTCVPSLYAR